ncbi:MAG: hypothetical protein R2879_05870 [Saprospiraceae bacterium]
MKNIQTTFSISSNQYSEVVMDKEGNSYISCFYRYSDNADHIFMVKLDSLGKMKWVQGMDYKGRATCIAIDQKEHIWAGGYFEDEVVFEPVRLENPGRHFFLAEFEPNGKCKQIIEVEGEAIPFDVTVNKDGSMMVFGLMGKEISFGGQKLENPNRAEGNFLAFFNSNKTCKWIKPISASLIKIKSNDLGDFYLTGAFNSLMKYDNLELKTTGNYDQDGFLMKINKKGETEWLNQFGNEGFQKNGYRTYERGNDLTFDAVGNPILASFYQTNYNHDEAELHLLQYNQDGNLLKDHILRKRVATSNATIGFDNGKYWATGSDFIQEVGFPDRRQSFFLQLDKDFSILKEIQAQNGGNTAIRSQFSTNGKTIMAGHYQDYLKIGKDSIGNDGSHTLFVVGI